MNDNFTKLVALSIVGGVTKALFSPRVPNPVVTNAAERALDHLEYKDLSAMDAVETKTDEDDA